MIQTRMDTLFERILDVRIWLTDFFYGTMELENSQFKVYIWFSRFRKKGT